MKSKSQRQRRRRGNAIVEFAIAAGVLVPAFTGVFQFGYTYYLYNNLESRVRMAARYASLRTYDSPNSTPSTAYKNAVVNMVTTGDPTVTTPALTTAEQNQRMLNKLQPSNVDVQMAFADGVPSEVTVRLVNFNLDAFFTTFNLAGKPSVAFPYVGRWDMVP